MQRRSAWLLHRLLLILLVSLSACTGQPTATTPTGTLRWSLDGVSDVTSLDPAHPADQQSNIVINLIFGGLIRIDQNLKVQPDGAERWEVSPDGQTYTFFIRRNLAFGDGTPVTAQDFRYSINRTLAPATAAYGSPAQLQHIVGALEVIEGRATEASGVRALDDYTLEIKLDAPLAYFLAQLNYPFSFVVPRHLIEREGAQWTEKAVGTGPFRLKEWRRGERIILEANPHYWQGAPGVATIELPFFKDIDAAYQSYRQGNLDLMGNNQAGVPASRATEVQDLPDLRRTIPLTVRYIGFNNQRPPFNNDSVRQAFALAVDRRVITRQVLSEAVQPTNRILPKGMPGSDIAITGQSFDPVGARAALGLAGYPSGQTLPPVTLTFSNEGDNIAVAEALRQLWRDTLGVDVRLDGLDLQAFIARLNATYREPMQGMDMYLSVWGADYPDPQNFLSQQLSTNSPYNNGHWSDPAFDQLVAQADSMGSASQYDERMRLYTQAEQIALNRVGWIPLYTPQATMLIRPNIRGLFFTAQGVLAPNWTQVEVEK